MKTTTLYSLFLCVSILLFACRKDSLNRIANKVSSDELSTLSTTQSTVYIFGGTSIVSRDAATSQVYWSQTLPLSIYPYAGALIVGNSAYFISYTSSEYIINKFNLDTRNIAWQTTFAIYTADSMPFVKRLLYDAGKLYAQIDQIKSRQDIATTTKIAAFDTAGNNLWQSYFYTGPGAYRSIQQSNNATIFKDVIAVGLGHDMAAINAANGTLIWRKKTDRYTNYLMNPCINNGIIFSGTTSISNGYLFAMKLTTGKMIWQAPVDPGFDKSASPTVVNGKVVVNGITKIIAHDAVSGLKLWEYEDGANGTEYPYFSGITNLDSTIYATNNQATKIYAIDAGDGSLKYSNGYLSFNSDHAGPVAANGFLITGDSWLGHKCSTASTGSTLWSASGGALEFVIKDSNGKVYHNTESGMVQ